LKFSHYEKNQRHTSVTTLISRVIIFRQNVQPKKSEEEEVRERCIKHFKKELTKKRNQKGKAKKSGSNVSPTRQISNNFFSISHHCIQSINQYIYIDVHKNNTTTHAPAWVCCSQVDSSSTMESRRLTKP
jgi:hypothetical protein